MGLWPTYGDENPQRSWGGTIGASVAHALVRAAPRLLSALVGRCYRPSTSAETSLGAARMSACATFHPARGGGTACHSSENRRGVGTKEWTFASSLRSITSSA